MDNTVIKYEDVIKINESQKYLNILVDCDTWRCMKEQVQFFVCFEAAEHLHIFDFHNNINQLLSVCVKHNCKKCIDFEWKEVVKPWKWEKVLENCSRISDSY